MESRGCDSEPQQEGKVKSAETDDPFIDDTRTVQSDSRQNIQTETSQKQNHREESESCSYRTRSSRKSRFSNISYKRLEEEQRKAELLAKRESLKRKRDIEIAKLTLKLQEEELALNTDVAAAEARTNVLDRYEQLECEQSEAANNSLRDLEEYVSRSRTTDIANDPVGLNPNAETFIPSTHAPILSVPVVKTTSSNNNATLLQHHIPEDNSLNLGAIQSIVQHLRKPIAEIKKFGGNPMEYRRFVRQFEAKVVMNCDSNDERMNYLEQLTFGEAQKVVSSLSHLCGDKAYPAARTLLEERYGDSQVIASAFIKRALEWPAIRAGDARSLDEYSLFLAECETANEGESIAISCLDFSENIKRLAGKLPLYLHDRWRNVVLRTKQGNRLVKFADFVNFVKNESKKANDPVYGSTAISVAQRNVSSKDSKRGQNVTCEITENPNRDTQYSFCENSSHDLRSCKRILSASLQERYTHLKTKALRFGCLRKGHKLKQCRNRITCSVCNKRHPTMLHDDSRMNAKHAATQKPNTSSQQHNGQSNTAACNEQSNTASCNVCTVDSPDASCQVGADEASCAMAIIPVKVKLKNKPYTVETYAFFDSGSTVSFCTEKLMHQLNGSGKRTSMSFKTMGNPIKLNTFAFDGLQVCDMSTHHVVDMPRVYTKETMPVTKEHIPTSADISKWQHLTGIHIQEIEADIGLMIGNNVPDAYTPFETLTGPSGSPHGTRTRLGWIIWNVIKDNTLADMSVNHVQIQSQTEADTELHELVKRSINLDFPKRLIDNRREHSREDKHFLEQVNQSVRFEDGHYCIALPFRHQNMKLPCNVTQGLQRLKGLKNKLLKDSKFKNDYIGFMETPMEKGYAEPVPEKDLSRNDGRVWYIPHHGVYHPKKPEKIRVVFDCSASYRGVSLNHQSLQGPDLANNLLGALLRFREERVAILGDIEAMFYQVKEPPSDRDCLHFFWWPKGDLTKEPSVYRMVVHLFGATSSPSCCNFALKRTAQEHGNDFNKVTVDTFTKNMYVDDCLASCLGG